MKGTRWRTWEFAKVNNHSTQIIILHLTLSRIIVVLVDG